MASTSDPIPVLDLSPQHDALWDELNAAFQRVLRSNRFIMGEEVRAFEEEVARYLGARHAIGVNSGTDALVISLRALGVGPGDEVITTPFTFFATAESISMVGATPVFADIDPASLNLDPSGVEAALTEQTKAIMPVHLFGRPAAMGRLIDLAERQGLFVVEDCAQSFGARYQGDCATCDAACQARSRLLGRQTGTLGHLGAYSFFPSKNLGGFGDGGLIVTDDDALAEQVRMLRVHGARQKYHNEILGYNSRLDALQAALLRVKLPHLDAANEGRRRVARLYEARLGYIEGIATPPVAEGHVFHQYTVRVGGGRRDAVKRYLAEQRIQTMVYYPVPQDRLPIYDGQHPPNPVSDQAAREVLSLPIWPSMNEAVVDRVGQALEEALAMQGAPSG